jgi:RND superfamily putative drug exporter
LAARRRWWFLGVWLALAVVLAVLAVTVGGKTSDNIVVPGAPSQDALDVLEADFPEKAGGTAVVVFQGPSGSAVTTGTDGQAVDASVTAVAKLPHVVNVQGPEGPLAAAFTSKSGNIAFAQIQYDEPATSLPSDVLDQLEEATAPATSAGINVQYGGEVVDYVNRAEVGPSDLIGLAVAVVILLVAFGSVIAMGLPIVTALLALGCGLALIILLAAITDVGTLSPTVGAMIGLGVGIDYSLFIITRHRESLAAGRSVEDALGHSLATAGVAVLFAGTTVIVALLGLRIADIPYITVLAFTTAMIVAITMGAAITLLPGLTAIAGTRIDKWSVPHLGHGRPSGRPTFWHRWARGVTRHPWVFGTIALAALLVLIAPVPNMRLGVTDDGDDPTSETQRQAYDLISEGFGPGLNGPLLVSVSLPAAGDDSVLQPLQQAISKAPDVKAALPAEVSPSKTAALIVVIPDSSPDAEATAELVSTLRDTTIPAALGSSGAEAYVGGLAAEYIDVSDRMTARLPWFIGAVVIMAFLLLTVAFRSVVIAATAAVMNLLSVGAAYGVVVAVFQEGWGKGIIGLDQTIPISPFVPMMMFAALFGLSMDYQVFLLTRIREHWVATGDNSGSVTEGLASTARVISSAALIMISVFLSFVPNPNPVVKMFGIGLATAVFVDATLVRLLLVPSIMEIFGRANWWLPRWLDRVLPRISLEGMPEPETAPAPVSPAGSARSG